MSELEDGELLSSGLPCIIKDCESSDAMSLYEHEDGRVNAHCFSCGGSLYSVDPDTLEEIKLNQPIEKEENFNMQEVDSILEDFSSDRLELRRIPLDVAELYGVKVSYDGNGKQESYMYPATKDNNTVGYSVRDTFKKGDKQLEKKPELLGVMKKFRAVGNMKPTKIELFGQSLFTSEQHKRIFITTGQEDALAGYNMTAKTTKAKKGYAFVSVVGGDEGGIKNLKANLQYVSKFEEIYLCCDLDTSGKEFLDAACKVLPIGKVHIVSWGDVKASNGKPAKDLSDIWNHGSKSTREHNAQYFYRQIWNAERYSPIGIKSLSEGWEDYLHRGEAPLIPFPDSFGDLNELTYGGYGADGEIINIAAPSSVGKSSFVKEMVYTALERTEHNIGVISLEETLPEFLEGMLSVHMSKQLNEIPLDQRDRVAEKAAMMSLLRINNPDGSDRIHFFDDPGACRDEDELWEKVDFLVQGLDCKIIVLDPVTLALSIGIDDDDYTATLVKKVKRNKLAWINVHHVRKSSGGTTANSEGADLAEEDIKGSGSHFQTGMINLIFTRNKVHDNIIIKNTTKIKMTKCRRHGKSTGIAGYVFYNGDTGRLERGISPEEILANEDDIDDFEEE